jgi:hypothetical protein
LKLTFAIFARDCGGDIICVLVVFVVVAAN